MADAIVRGLTLDTVSQEGVDGARERMCQSLLEDRAYPLVDLIGSEVGESIMEAQWEEEPTQMDTKDDGIEEMADIRIDRQETGKVGTTAEKKRSSRSTRCVHSMQEMTTPWDVNKEKVEIKQIPGMGWCLFAKEGFNAQDRVLCAYQGYKTTVRSARGRKCKSRYTVELEAGKNKILVVDAWDPVKNLCVAYGGYANDGINMIGRRDLWNAELEIDPYDDKMVILRPTRDILPGEQIYVWYGPEYWCSDDHPVELIAMAVMTYGIDIETSTWETGSHGNWRKLKKIKELRDILKEHKYIPPTNIANPFLTKVPPENLYNSIDCAVGEALRLEVEIARSIPKVIKETNSNHKSKAIQDTKARETITEADHRQQQVDTALNSVVYPNTSATDSRLREILNSEAGDMTRVVTADTTGTITVMKYDLRRIRDGQLNDVVIDAYLGLLCASVKEYRLECISAQYTETILGITTAPVIDNLHHKLRKHDLYGSSMIFCPIIRGGHITMVVANRFEGTITHYDSLGTGSEVWAHRFKDFLEAHWNWRVLNGKHGLTGPYQEQWTVRGSVRNDTPQQIDGVACGVFTLAFATLLAQRLNVGHFHTTQVTSMRSHISHSILLHRCLPISLMGNNRSSGNITIDQEPVQYGYQRLKGIRRGLLYERTTQSGELIEISDDENEVDCRVHTTSSDIGVVTTASSPLAVNITDLIIDGNNTRGMDLDTGRSSGNTTAGRKPKRTTTEESSRNKKRSKMAEQGTKKEASNLFDFTVEDEDSDTASKTGDCEEGSHMDILPVFRAGQDPRKRRKKMLEKRKDRQLTMQNHKQSIKDASCVVPATGIDSTNEGVLCDVVCLNDENASYAMQHHCSDDVGFRIGPVMQSSINNIEIVEVSSPPPLHHSAVRGVKQRLSDSRGIFEKTTKLKAALDRNELVLPISDNTDLATLRRRQTREEGTGDRDVDDARNTERTTRQYAMEEPPKRRRLLGTDVEAPDGVDDDEAAASSSREGGSSSSYTFPARPN